MVSVPLLLIASGTAMAGPVDVLARAELGTLLEGALLELPLLPQAARARERPAAARTAEPRMVRVATRIPSLRGRARGTGATGPVRAQTSVPTADVRDVTTDRPVRPVSHVDKRRLS